MKDQRMWSENGRAKATASVARRVLLLVLVCAMLFTIAACSGSIEDKIPGTYYTGHHSIQLFSDGTYDEEGEYGTGRWTLLDGNVLKLTDFYGESVTREIEDVTSTEIVFKSGYSWKREK